MAATAHLTLVAPDNENFTVHQRQPNCQGANPTPISITGASHRARGRKADRGHEGQPLGTP